MNSSRPKYAGLAIIRIAPKSLAFLNYRTVKSFIPSTTFKDDQHVISFRRSNTDNYPLVVENIVNDANNELLGELWPKEKRFLTGPKRLIVQEIHNVVKSLTSNYFVGKSGSASRLLFGEKGIGKSNSLTLSVMAFYISYPNVVPIYVEYSGSSDSHEYKEPHKLISDAMGFTPYKSISECVKELEQMNRYVLFVADEIDQIYNSKENESQRLRILLDLQEMGSQTSGRLYTIICGSASVTPLLISKNGIHDEDVALEYPLIGNCPNLNGSKFASFRLSSGKMIEKDMEVIAAAYKTKDTHVLYFLCGSNLRLINRVIDALSHTELKQGLTDTLSDLVCPPELWDQRANKMSMKCKALIESLNLALSKKNYKILKSVIRDHNNILKIQWISELKPLSKKEIEACVAGNILIVNHLVDKGYFCGSPTLEALYPSKPLDLVHFFPKYERQLKLNSLPHKILQFLKISSSQLSQESEFQFKWFLKIARVAVVKLTELNGNIQY